jgi:hypothetical protein
MESEIASLRSKDNRRRDYYEGDSRSRVRSRSRKFIFIIHFQQYINIIQGSRSRSPKDRDTRRYPPRDEMNGDNTGNSYPRRPRYNEGKYSIVFRLLLIEYI